MKNNSHPPLVVNLDRTRLFLCSSRQPNPIAYPLPPTSFQDLEIVNRDEFIGGLRAFVEKSQISPSPVVIVLSQLLYFDKAYPGSVPPATDEIQKFIDKVPFSSPSPKLFKVPGGFKAVVINRDLYETVRYVFESAGFKILAVVPGFVLEPLGVKEDFNAQACSLVIKKLDMVIANSFTGLPDPQNIHSKEQAFLKQHAAAMAIISVALVIFSGIMVYIALNRRPPLPVSANQAIPTSPPRPTATLTPTPSVNPAQFSVQILNSSGITGRGAAVEDVLSPLGLTQITITTARVTVTGKSQLTFKSTVPALLRDQVLNSLKPLLPDISIRELPDAQFAIIINISKSTP